MPDLYSVFKGATGARPRDYPFCGRVALRTLTMTRYGSLILSDVRTPTLALTCEACGRRGRIAWRGSWPSMVYMMTNCPNGVLYTGVTSDIGPSPSDIGRSTSLTMAEVAACASSALCSRNMVSGG
jgi:hypothetical protein